MAYSHHNMYDNTTVCINHCVADMYAHSVRQYVCVVCVFMCVVCVFSISYVNAERYSSCFRMYNRAILSTCTHF